MRQSLEDTKQELAKLVLNMEQVHYDIGFVQSILPSHYTVKESKRKGSIHCKSRIGLRKGDVDDDEHFGYILKAIKNHFGKRFMEVDHNTCTWHLDFTIHLTNTPLD